MSVNAGAAAVASSERKSPAAKVPLSPAPTYIRVLPFGSFVTAIESRSMNAAAGCVGPKMRVHDAPPSSDR